MSKLKAEIKDISEKTIKQLKISSKGGAGIGLIDIKDLAFNLFETDENDKDVYAASVEFEDLSRVNLTFKA